MDSGSVPNSPFVPRVPIALIACFNKAILSFGFVVVYLEAPTLLR